MSSAPKVNRVREVLIGVLLTIGLVVLVTLAIYPMIDISGQHHGSVVYLIPVVIAATRWGIVPAIVAAVCGVAASAFLFYEPLYSLHITDAHELLNLLLFIFVAVVVSQLANRLKRQLELARQREVDVRDLYTFSRRLAGAFDVSDIHAAIEHHLATVMQRQVILFASAGEASNLSSSRRTGGMVPEPVLTEVAKVAGNHEVNPSGVTVPVESGDIWLVRAVSAKSAEFGAIAINLGRQSPDNLNELRSRLDAVLTDATATLERLDVAHAIGEARMRSQTEVLREALIESVSHELRTPLASILGAATVLNTAPALHGEPKLKALVNDVRDEAERLNNDIQNLLDASRISSEGVKPHIDWTEPADIIHSAIERCRRRLVNRKVTVDLAPELPLVYIDPVLAQQALVQIFDNAAKYSPAGSQITVSARVRDGRIIIEVGDEGAGLTRNEQARMWERFVRGERHAAIAGGSGLGLWIANAFIAANGGSMSADSQGPDRGTTVQIALPVMQTVVPQLESDEKDE